MRGRKILITTERIFIVSTEVILRAVENKLVVIPLFENDDLDAELFAVTGTGKLFLEKLDGQRSLGEIIKEMSMQFDAPPGVIEHDLMQLVDEFLAKKLIVEIPPG